MGKERLNQYISNLSEERFKWGVHDCFTFTNGAWKALYGYGYADDWIGKYLIDGQPMSLPQLREAFECFDLSQPALYEALNKKLKPSDRASYGSLVTTKAHKVWDSTGYALGISLGSRSVFVGIKGLVKIHTQDIENCWIPNV